MSQARSENGSTSDILGHLETYEKTSEQFRRFTSLKANVEKERQSVQLHIYERVRAEYDQKMLAVEEDLKKQRKSLEEKIQELLARRSELDGVCRRDAERLEEIDFRTRVGEFTVEECKEERSRLEQRTQSQSRELAQLEEIVGRCTKSGLLAEQEPSPSPSQTATPEEVRDEPQPRPDKDGSERASHQPAEAAVTAAEPETPETAAAEAEEVGMSSQRLQRIQPMIRGYIEKALIPGAVTMVARQGKIVHLLMRLNGDAEELKRRELDHVPQPRSTHPPQVADQAVPY